MIRGGDLTELALKVFGQYFAFVAADLTQMHHVHLVGAQLNGRIRLQIGFGTAYIVETLAIGYGIDEQQAIGPLYQFGSIGIFIFGLSCL